MRRSRGDEGDEEVRPGLTPAVAEQLADAMFALSTPSRVQILGCLLGGPRSVADLTETLGMEQSAVSHQLRVLRDHHLVVAERVGRRRLYALYDEHVTSLLEAGLHHVESRRRGLGTSSEDNRPDRTADGTPRR